MTAMRMMIKDIKLEGMNLSVGDRIRIVCPNCFGGSTNEKSMSLIREHNGLLYNCFRMNCGTKGFIGSRGSAEEYQKNEGKQRKTRSHFDFDVRDVFTPKWFEDKHPLSPYAKLLYCESEDRYIFECLDSDGYPWAYNYRSYSGAQPKSILRVENEKPRLHYATDTSTPPTVLIVEDVISADTLQANGLNAVALLGTDIQDDGILNLLENGVKHIVICLDGDANKKAVALQKRLSLYFNWVDVNFLDKDIKNKSAEEFDEWRNTLSLP